MGQLASDFGDRVREAREALGETQPVFAARWERMAKQVSSWENGHQVPHHSVVRRVAEKNGWPLAMFEEGGPRPVDALQGPLTASVVRERVHTPFAAENAAAALYVRSLKELMDYLETGRDVPAMVALDALTGLWARVVELAPQLRQSGGAPADKASGA